ncbi:unnamed protein product [Aphanomyces euteiches]|uniref:Uncharacterized protein n=1 Tax=Aphanomyces euteiches TaxID=100861 RepID=A0A6G0WCH6_9STRA|nr:hypothetical protein Ae201684_016707 [Aphanomyces euteiches]KAH9157756.1 hypothetical protein AeRB84_000393 [Aphanomyces euteiches]
MGMSKLQHGKDDQDNEAVVFNPDAYSVVSSWISKSALNEEDDAAPRSQKPLYSKSQPLKDEDKFLASKILKKKYEPKVDTRKVNDENDDDDDETYQLKGQHQAKKQKTMSVQAQLLETLRLQQERRKQKNKKKNKKP